MFLCDTNIISELAKPKPNQGVLRWAQTVRYPHISVITIEEIWYGLAWKPNPRIQNWIEEFLNNVCIIMPINAAIAHHTGILRGELQKKGQTCTQADMLIAATAQINQLTLVTRNIKDFQDCQIGLLNPFESS